jgi:hypothetical protein
VTETQLKNLLTWTVSMAADFSIETRIRRLIRAHWEAGDTPRTLVMSLETWAGLIGELDGRLYGGYYWTPTPPSTADKQTHTFMGLPILIKNFLPVSEVIVGV